MKSKLWTTSPVESTLTCFQNRVKLQCSSTISSNFFKTYGKLAQLITTASGRWFPRLNRHFSSDFVNNSDNYIFSFDEFLLANCSPFTPNSWATLKEDLRARFFRQITKDSPKSTWLLRFDEFFFQIIFLLFLNRSSRSQLLLHCSADENTAQATAKITYFEIVQPSSEFLL